MCLMVFHIANLILCAGIECLFNQLNRIFTQFIQWLCYTNVDISLLNINLRVQQCFMVNIINSSSYFMLKFRYNYNNLNNIQLLTYNNSREVLYKGIKIKYNRYLCIVMYVRELLIIIDAKNRIFACALKNYRLMNRQLHLSKFNYRVMYLMEFDSYF